jgi:hypothetical protein
MTTLTTILDGLRSNAGTMAEAGRSRNLGVLRDMLGPAFRGLVLRAGKADGTVAVRAHHDATFDFGYGGQWPVLARLYDAAKQSQWDGARALDWSVDVVPDDAERALISDDILPLAELPAFQRLPARDKNTQRHAMLAWLLSQFLHGEQGALFAACQVTESVGSLDAKLYGSTQVVDEGRHVEVFHRYLSTKLGRTYQINDNLYVVVDAIMRDSRWDLKFLGMQIMIEGLALGAFGTLRNATQEPLLKELLRNVITDEARHVHFGVVSLERLYREELSDRERRDREDWAFELALLMRNRFLAHEFYDEYYAPIMKRAEWDKRLLESRFMARFRSTMFRRIIPNLRRIGLLSERVRPHYAALGLLAYENERAAPELEAKDLLA